MFNLLNSIRFTFRASLFLAIGTLAFPSIGYPQNNPRFSSVLEPNQKITKELTSLLTVPNGIKGIYESNGKIIYFETRRGPRTPRYLRVGDSTTPEYEIDVRFFDEDGKPFLTQIGGDAPIDQAWAESGSKRKVDAETKADFDLAFKSLEALKKLKFNQKLKQEHQAIINLAPIVESAQVVEKIEGVMPQPSVQAQVVTNNYRQQIAIHHKKCCFGLGRHSATIGRYISATGITTTAVITCNHGTCANQMALKCSWTSASPGNRTTRLNNNISCSTPYNPTSVFGHNSNDDTDLQYRAVRYNILPSRTGAMCNDSSVNNEPTHCY